MSEDIALESATLMQLCNAFVAAVFEGEGDWTEALAALDKAIDGKVERYQRAAHYIRARRAGILAEANYYLGLGKSLVEKAKALASQDDRMEQALLKTMHETGKTVIETSLGTLRVKKTPHVELHGDMDVIMANLPELYTRKADPEVNKKAILDDYRSIVKALVAAEVPESEAISTARLKMPVGIEIVYNEGVGGY